MSTSQKTSFWSKLFCCVSDTTTKNTDNNNKKILKNPQNFGKPLISPRQSEDLNKINNNNKNIIKESNTIKLKRKHLETESPEELRNKTLGLSEEYTKKCKEIGEPESKYIKLKLEELESPEEEIYENSNNTTTDDDNDNRCKNHKHSDDDSSSSGSSDDEYSDNESSDEEHHCKNDHSNDNSKKTSLLKKQISILGYSNEKMKKLEYEMAKQLNKERRLSGFPESNLLNQLTNINNQTSLTDDNSSSDEESLSDLDN